MRLTSDTILQAEQGLNCIGDRELVLRNKAIPAIENLAVARDAFDTIDLSANMISVLGDGFPPFPRLQTLYLGSNRITRILPGVADSLPNLQVLVLTSNRLSTVDDLNLKELSRFPKLEVLSVLDNPVADVPAIREKLIGHLPALKVLNFTKVTLLERQAATKANPTIHLGKRKSEQTSKASKRRRVASKDGVRTFVVGALGDSNGNGNRPAKENAQRTTALTKEQSEALKAYIEKAESVQEVVRMQEAMRNGTVADFLKSVGACLEGSTKEKPSTNGR